MFIENRGKTAFWAKVAQRLTLAGHEVGWMLQNPAYAPRCVSGNQFFLGFPKASDLLDAPIPEAVSTDRGRQYFDAGSLHYTFYAKRVAMTLDHFCPDVVLGEPTLMHELLTIAECRKRGLPYLHPTMTRYPGGRFNVLDGDTQLPVSGSGDRWASSELIEWSSAIQEGRSLPSYMTKPTSLAAQLLFLRRILGQTRVVWGWLRGERFNTPSPARKAALREELRKNLAAWGELALMPEVGKRRVVLYPLQMQPEANIDVWGRPFSNQVELLRRLLAALPADGAVAVKANPKPKYEVSAELLSLAREDARVILLPTDCSMEAAQAVSNGAVTVSGTVGFEAVFGRGRCLSLRHPVLERYLPEFHCDSPEVAVRRLLTDPNAGCGSAERGAYLLGQLVADSFEGTINEPTYDPNCLSPTNIGKVSAAIEQVLAELRQKAIA